MFNQRFKDDSAVVPYYEGGAEDPKKIQFSSRRLRNFDDDKSQDSGVDYVLSEVSEQSKPAAKLDEGQPALKPNPRFRNYSSVFRNLVKSSNVVTMYPIVSAIITYDSTKVVTVTRKNDTEYWVKQYDLESYEITFEEKIGGNKG